MHKRHGLSSLMRACLFASLPGQAALGIMDTWVDLKEVHTLKKHTTDNDVLILCSIWYLKHTVVPWIQSHLRSTTKLAQTNAASKKLSLVGLYNCCYVTYEFESENYNTCLHDYLILLEKKTGKWNCGAVTLCNLFSCVYFVHYLNT